MAVISCGRENSYGHPHKETIERLKKEELRYGLRQNQGQLNFGRETESG